MGMTGNEIAAEARAAVTGLSQGFMFDPATYATAAERGFDGLDFYFAGRAGVLGEVEADVVTASLVFFHPATVRAAWEGSAAVMARAEAARLFAGCAASWADAHLGDGVDWPRLAELAGRIVEAAAVGGAPVFAGWRALPVPSDPKQAAVHHLNGLRELRMARHAAAVLVTGLEPGDAVRHHAPRMAAILGWDEAPVADEVPVRWREAEALTNRAAGRDYVVLGDDGDDFVELATAALAAVA